MVVADDVQLGSLVEQQGVGGVEVLRAGPFVIGPLGVAASDEPEDLSVMGDREDDPVAESVDEASGRRLFGCLLYTSFRVWVFQA